MHIFSGDLYRGCEIFEVNLKRTKRPMNPESIEIIKTLITAFTTLLVSLGTWHVSMRQYRAKNESMVRDAIEDVKDTVTRTNADTQEHLAVIDLKIETLSERVEKHNKVIERTFDLEKSVALNTSEINHIKERIS